MQDDLLTSLAKVGDLKVISRTSVMSYRGNTRNIREIGKALGVGAVLEGSVRRSGNRVRVNVQLIDAANDEHIWAEDYDRDLTDVFAIQSELANEIASVLKAKLSPGEKAEIERKPTENAQAYLLYLQAREYVQRPDELLDDMLKAEQLFERAIQLDPSFALAHAQLSRLESWVYHANDPAPARLAKAKSTAGEALKLQPNLPEAHLALGYCAYYGDRDYARALQEFAIAQRGLPNNADIYVATAAIARRQGKWQQSIADSKKAIWLDSKNAIDWANLGMTYRALRDYPAAADTFERGAAVAPNSINMTGMRASMEFDWKGDLRPVKDFLARLPPDVDPHGQITLARVQVKLAERKFGEALELIQRSGVELFPTENPVLLPRAYVEAAIYLLMHDGEKTRTSFEKALRVVEDQVRDASLNSFRHSLLGKIYAGLGRKDDALREGKRALELLPESLDAVESPTAVIDLAEIYALLGDADGACPLLDHSLATPNGITIQRLKIEPTWDALRSHPRFQQLVAKYDAKF